ncbi:MAG: M50 family metallopeptidase [Thermomicrobiales bacterium]
MQRTMSASVRPAVSTLVIALALTVVLWLVPFAGIVTYPFRLFVTFIHESGHALAALLTGNHVYGLQVSPDGSGLTYTTGGGLAGLLVASAGNLGAMAYGVLLLALIRRAVSARAILSGTAIYIFAFTFLFGLHAPFTLLAGFLIALGLLAVAMVANLRLATFLICFLAVQCIANALFDLRTLVFLSAPFASHAHTDAENMAQATGLPAIFWALLWMALALIMLVAALGDYATGLPIRTRATTNERDWRASLQS